MHRLNAIYQASLKLLAPQSIEQTYATLVEEATKLVNAKHASIFVLEGRTLKRAYTTTKSLQPIKPRRNGLTYQAFKKREAMLRSGAELAKTHTAFRKQPVGSDILVPLTYGDIAIGTLSVMSDVSVQYGDEELAIMRTFGPIAALAIRKATTKSELENALEIRNHFISIAAHELRNPLSSIYAYIQLIERQVSIGKLPELTKLAKIRNATKRLARMVDELLNTSRIEQGKLRFRMRPVDLLGVVRKSVEDYREKESSHRFVFRSRVTSRPCMISGDRDKLYQVVANIFNNSIKFSEVGTTIFTIIRERKLSYVLECTDQGYGMEPDELERVFEKYYTGRKKGNLRGMGLGLSLVKHIVEEHQGAVAITSEPNKGTTVKILFPKLEHE